MTSTTYHAEAARRLRAHGIEVVYGLVGDANLFLVDHWVRHEGGRYVAAVHEASAVMMAAGHARATGEVGVATVTHGPGLTNTVTALVECAKSSVPVLLVTGRTAAGRPDAPQHLDQRPLVEATGAAFEPAGTVASLATDMARALTRARREQRPVVLELPVDLMWEDVGPASDHVPAEPATTDRPDTEPASEDVDRALGVVMSARRPVLLAGRGALEAREPLLRLARRLGAPVATTALARDLFAAEPEDLGIFGSLSTAATQDVLADADCVLAFGTSLSEQTTARGDLLRGKAVVHCDLAPASGHEQVRVTAGVRADSRAAAEALLRWLDEADAEPSGFAERATTRLAEPLRRVPGGRREGTVDLVEVLQHLQATLPRDRAVVVDVGRFALHALRHLSGTDARSSMWSGAGFASIGLGTGMAIGAAVARPDRPTVLLVGDGGFALGGLHELTTAVEHGLPLVCVVADDASYGAEHVQLTRRGMDPGVSLLRPPDLVEVARALGASGVRVTSDRELADLDEILVAARGPVVVDVRLDPDRVTSLE